MHWEGLAADSRGQWQRSWASQQVESWCQHANEARLLALKLGNSRIIQVVWQDFPRILTVVCVRGRGRVGVHVCYVTPHKIHNLGSFIPNHPYTHTHTHTHTHPHTHTHTHIPTLPSHPHPKSQQLKIPVRPSVLSRVRLFVTVWTVTHQAL